MRVKEVEPLMEYKDKKRKIKISARFIFAVSTLITSTITTLHLVLQWFDKSIKKEPI